MAPTNRATEIGAAADPCSSCLVALCGSRGACMTCPAVPRSTGCYPAELLDDLEHHSGHTGRSAATTAELTHEVELEKVSSLAGKRTACVEGSKQSRATRNKWQGTEPVEMMREYDLKFEAAKQDVLSRAAGNAGLCSSLLSPGPG